MLLLKGKEKVGNLTTLTVSPRWGEELTTTAWKKREERLPANLGKTFVPKRCEDRKESWVSKVGATP